MFHALHRLAALSTLLFALLVVPAKAQDAEAPVAETDPAAISEKAADLAAQFAALQDELVTMQESNAEMAERMQAKEIEANRTAEEVLQDKKDKQTFLLITLAATLFASMLARTGLRLLGSLTSKTRFTFDELAVDTLEAPLRLAVVVAGAHVSLRFVELSDAWEQRLGSWSEAVILLTFTFFAVRGVHLLAHLASRYTERTETKLDDQLLPVLERLAKVAVGLIGVVMAVEQLGYAVSSILAGFGLGGLAFALAAKDTVSNLFGSVMIFSDKPFEIGDWIKFKNTEGIVEQIGLRSTKVRTWEDTLYTIPNADIASAPVENVSRFNARRVYVKIPITLEAGADGVEKAVATIRDVLVDHPKVKKGHYVFFNEITDWGCSIMVYFFVGFTAWRVYLEARQEVLLDMMKRLEAEGVEMAYPTQVVHLEGSGLPPAPPSN
jgi:MscS family membrane protein